MTQPEQRPRYSIIEKIGGVLVFLSLVHSLISFSKAVSPENLASDLSLEASLQADVLKAFLTTSSSDGKANQSKHENLRSVSLERRIVEQTEKAEKADIKESKNETSPPVTEEELFNVIHLGPLSMSRNGAVIHVGKTGGSTLSTLLRDGCHDWMEKPCHIVSHETITSKKVGTYYHVPDFWKLPKSKHDFYIITIREPLDRTISAFSWNHVNNTYMMEQKKTMTEGAIWLANQRWQCFPSLERFSELIGDNVTNFNYPFEPSSVNSKSCPDLARAIMNNKVRYFEHLFFDLKRIRYFLYGHYDGGTPRDENGNVIKIPHRKIYVMRKEYFWEDWKTINNLLGEDSEVHVEFDHHRNMTGIRQSVTRDISTKGQLRLCKALTREYRAYVFFLTQAVNLSLKEVEETMDISRRACPNMDFEAMIQEAMASNH